MKYIVAFLIASGFIVWMCGEIYNGNHFHPWTVSWPKYYAAITIITGVALTPFLL